VIAGRLRHLELAIAAGDVDQHSGSIGSEVLASLCVISTTGPETLTLNPLLGKGLSLEFDGSIQCVHCGRDTTKSFASGYCYPCFRTLARCDLCVMSPDRCHFHLGTCREPEWGEAFCMSDHIVYLANTSGLKVGITRGGREQGRWLDQGAVQALPILSAATRRDAGLAEVAIAKLIPDRTDWHRLVAGQPAELDLVSERDRLKAASLVLPEAVQWLTGDREQRFDYPIDHYPAVRQQLRASPAEGCLLEGNLLGVKGQYLLLSTGVFNVRRFAGYHVKVSLSDPFTEPTADSAPDGASDQLDLF